jgi:PhnB protein
MSNPRKNGSTSVTPYLAYADAPAAIEFLCKAFGFVERFRYPMPDGKIGHAELALGDAPLLLASEWEAANLVSPSKLSGLHAQIFCAVEDVDAHHARAREAGATIAAEPKDEHGMRRYRAVDPEGHRWMFAAPSREA